VIPMTSSFNCGPFSDDGDDAVCYEIAFTADGWNNARELCHIIHAEIASVHNDEENAFLRRLAESNGAKSVLLGGSLAGKGVFFGWVDGSAWDYANFKPGYPKKGQGNCLFMDTRTETGQWINGDCNTRTPVACSGSPLS
ncbi:hypothetical protein PMAYCL1PPCAC_22352, partial [Pristionchus mayeri]